MIKEAREMDEDAGRARELLERLCRQPSMAAEGVGIDEMAGLTDTLLREAGFVTRRLAVAGAPPIVYGEQRGRAPFTLLFYNHYDVQPPGPLGLWDSPPFEPTERDRDGALPITVKWIVEGEEETGSVHFGDIIAPHAALLRADGCLWEGGGFGANGRPVLSLGHKGMLYVELAARALTKDAHSMKAATLPSAAWRLVEALGTLRDSAGRVRIPGFYDAVREPTPAERAALAALPDRAERTRAAYGVADLLDGLSGVALRERAAFGPTCNIAGIVGGYTGAGAMGVLPARATAKVDFRLVPDQDPKAIAAALRAYLDAGGYDDVRTTVLWDAVPVLTPLDDPFARRVAAIVRAYDPDHPPLTQPLSGGTLGLLGPLRDLVGVPGLGAPGNPIYGGSDAHAPNENIRLGDLPRAVDFNVYLLRALGQAV